jgi:inward rectifier potassium channel
MRGNRAARPRRVRVGDREVIAHGLDHWRFGDVYHYAMVATWPRFIAATAIIYLVVNVVFAALYRLGDQPIANAGASFEELFYFSVETLATVGYGDMHPQTRYAHIVATIEIFSGLSITAALTGLFFARFSRPRARVLFARNPVVGQVNGQPTLMVRMANARHNMITDAAAKLWMTQIESSAEGIRYRRFRELRLDRAANPMFALSWTIFHPIDDTSPLYHRDAASLAEVEANFVVTFGGLDETSAQQLNARTLYTSDDILWGHHYVDILDVDGDGTPRIDYRRFHDVRAE